MDDPVWTRHDARSTMILYAEHFCSKPGMWSKYCLMLKKNLIFDLANFHACTKLEGGNTPMTLTESTPEQCRTEIQGGWR